jgi:hypothetical protein
MLDVTTGQMRRMQTAEMRFHRAVIGYRMEDHNLNEDIREQMGVTYIDTTIKSIRRVV